ncbi:uncharacterized protein [Palaemon carinicauda]|uniref:uncharacterized protein isoform X2 n=1 Tax=Palaemon carinicauda TaxID=392227 RepID=UPI0035B5969A
MKMGNVRSGRLELVKNKGLEGRQTCFCWHILNGNFVFNEEERGRSLLCSRISSRQLQMSSLSSRSSKKVFVMLQDQLEAASDAKPFFQDLTSVTSYRHI